MESFSLREGAFLLRHFRYEYTIPKFRLDTSCKWPKQGETQKQIARERLEQAQAHSQVVAQATGRRQIDGYWPSLSKQEEASVTYPREIACVPWNFFNCYTF